MPDREPSLLLMEHITKRFAGVVALRAVDFSLRPGEVHALVGENGAGKSTLIRVITGAHRPDDGRIVLDGEEVAFHSPAQAQAAGITAVHQEIHLLALRTVAENIFLGREPRRFGLVDWTRMYRDARVALERLGLDIDPRAVAGTLSTARQQMVAIARAMSIGARVLVLDEPTSSLAEREVGVLHDLVRRLRDEGTAIVYVSHRFDELYAICDRVTILRDGALVGTRPLAGLDRVDLVCMMLGRTRDQLRGQAPPRRERSTPDAVPPLLAVRAIARRPKLRGVTLDVRKGEIVGLAGLLGSGRTETARALFGIAPAEHGTIASDGRELALREPRDAVAARFAFLSEDRKAEGIVPELSVRENLTLAALPLLTRFGVIDRGAQARIVDRFIARLGIRASSADQKIRELSGGNQQKVLLARWLCANPALLILDEPTRGIDVGARAEIQALVEELAAEGLGVLLISSELEELVDGSTRIVVLRDGRSVADLRGDEVAQEAIVSAMAGTAGVRSQA
ncbi:MAG: sugar ABC transporter ATP-binding protein [Gemmatimonadaceae bacterium]|nr:sugar ABC transporter ATP-binding protein [Gemmatimonadaceae bacterium]NUQ91624.1 sugar ABC transporter ATP-binding protein [Gemmatimonadaceae bacterium]NUR18109.1 sugar ABC transporter ATP-binding protein [Gemmatimonadaceae bacterium]